MVRTAPLHMHDCTQEVFATPVPGHVQPTGCPRCTWMHYAIKFMKDVTLGCSYYKFIMDIIQVSHLYTLCIYYAIEGCEEYGWSAFTPQNGPGLFWPRTCTCTWAQVAWPATAAADRYCRGPAATAAADLVLPLLPLLTWSCRYCRC